MIKQMKNTETNLAFVGAAAVLLTIGACSINHDCAELRTCTESVAQDGGEHDGHALGSGGSRTSAQSGGQDADAEQVDCSDFFPKGSLAGGDLDGSSTPSCGGNDGGTGGVTVRLPPSDGGEGGDFVVASGGSSNEAGAEHAGGSTTDGGSPKTGSTSGQGGFTETAGRAGTGGMAGAGGRAGRGGSNGVGGAGGTTSTGGPQGAGGTSDCPVYYRDSDGDGYGDPQQRLASCSQPIGYVSNSSDCCDADSSAKPGQSMFFVAPNGCNNFDYDCDQEETKKVNGPTGCYDSPMECEYTESNDKCVVSARTPPPTNCNGEFTDYLQADCGAAWHTDTKGCGSYTCAGPACSCTSYTNGSNRGTQACR